MSDRSPVVPDVQSFPDYSPRWSPNPVSGDRHTLAAFMNRPERSLDSFPGRRLEIEALDGSGDQLIAQWLRPLNVPVDQAAQGPTVLLLHGLGGSARSVYVHKTALFLLDQNQDVMLLNFRGAGASAETCQKHHHPGRSEDIRALVRRVVEQEPDIFKVGVVPVGFSLGGNVLLKYLGETSDQDAAIPAAMTISAPIDLATTSRHLGRWRNLPYRTYLLAKLRERLYTDPHGLSDEDKRRLRWTTSIWDFDRCFTAPRNGYDSVEAYYRDNSCLDVLPQVNAPTYLLHAGDDPFVPPDSYRDFDWSSNPALHPMRTDAGGHVGFVQQDGTRWHDRCLVHLLDVLQRQAKG